MPAWLPRFEESVKRKRFGAASQGAGIQNPESIKDNHSFLPISSHLISCLSSIWRALFTMAQYDYQRLERLAHTVTTGVESRRNSDVQSQPRPSPA